ncbi:hypothetical protein KEJ49_07290 [Candidatus Bathyarchaeota archaeon]|nr:hypothetical protein [Candidatus Bathyarchaeota archaeon]
MVYLKKVSLYVDERLWARFKEAVLRKHGTLRKLSGEVENLLRTSLIDEEVEQALKRMGVDIEVPISSEEVKRGRPELRGPPSENLIREMRGWRADEGIP